MRLHTRGGKRRSFPAASLRTRAVQVPAQAQPAPRAAHAGSAPATQPHCRLLRHPLPCAACIHVYPRADAQPSPLEDSEQFRPKSSTAVNGPGPGAVAGSPRTSRGTALVLSHPQKSFVQHVLPHFMPASSFLLFPAKCRNCFTSPHPARAQTLPDLSGHPSKEL